MEKTIGLVIVILALLLNVLFIGRDLPYITHPDEPRLVRGAMAMASADFNPHFFVYPSLWFYLLFLAQSLGLAFGYLLGLVKNFTDLMATAFIDQSYFFLVSRLASAFLGAAAVGLVWLMTKDFPFWGRLAATLSLALFGPLINSSHFAIVDGPLTFFVTLALFFYQRQSFYLGAAAAGLATSIKYNGALVFLPLLFLLWQQEKNMGEVIKKSLRLLLTAALAFFITSPFVLLDLPTFLKDWQVIRQGTVATGAAPDFLAYFKILFQNQGWLLPGLALLGFFNKRYRPWLISLAFFALPYFLLLQAVDYKAERFFLPLAPVLAIGLGSAISFLSERARLAPLLLAVILIPSVLTVIALEKNFTIPTAPALATEYLYSHLAPGSKIFIDNSSRLTLIPDRETVEARRQIWEKETDSRSQQLFRAYGYYLKTPAPARGYQLVPTVKTNVHSFNSGLDEINDYQKERLTGVQYLVVAEEVLLAKGATPRALFYEYVRAQFKSWAAFDSPGQKIVILKRNVQ